MSVLSEGKWLDDLELPFHDLENFRNSHLLLMLFVFQKKKKIAIDGLLISLEPRSQQLVGSTPSCGGCTGRCSHSLLVPPRYRSACVPWPSRRRGCQETGNQQDIQGQFDRAKWGTHRCWGWGGLYPRGLLEVMNEGSCWVAPGQSLITLRFRFLFLVKRDSFA